MRLLQLKIRRTVWETIKNTLSSSLGKESTDSEEKSDLSLLLILINLNPQCSVTTKMIFRAHRRGRVSRKSSEKEKTKTIEKKLSHSGSD